VEPRTFFDPVRPIDALKVLSDPYSISIISATQKQEKTAVELSQRFRIPIAVAYRRVAELVQAGVLEQAGQALTQEARRIWMYRARLASALAEYDGSSLRIVFRNRDGSTQDFGGPWKLQEVAGPPGEWEAERLRKGTSLYFPTTAPGGDRAHPSPPARESRAPDSSPQEEEAR
jgi:hypothetical protein